MIRTLLPYLFILGAAFLLSIAIFSESGLPALQRLGEEKKELFEQARELEEKLANKRGKIRSLQEDPLALEMKAREDLGMVKEDERVYVFPDQ